MTPSRTIFSTSCLSLSLLLGACRCAVPAGLDHPTTETIPGTTVKLHLVQIPSGKAQVADPMDPGKQQKVEVRSFLMSSTEVTFDAYDIFVYGLDQTRQAPDVDATTKPSKPYIPPDRGFGHTGYPAIGMSFRGADEFCKWLSQKTGHTYRLATEAEWEHAARAGSTGNYAVDKDKLTEAAWFKDNSDAKTHPVGTKKPNAWGLFDMHGNAAEWVVGFDGKPVTKGGSFKDEAGDLEITDRVKQSPSWNASDPQMPKSKWWLADCSFVGFRLVREIDAAPTAKPEEPKTEPAPQLKPPKDRTDDHPAPSVPK